jgi:Phospholipase_D-nuclease N-terminal
MRWLGVHDRFDHQCFGLVLPVTPIPLTSLWPGLLIPFVHFGLIAVALLRLRYQIISDMARVLWVIVIVIIPIGGPLAFLIAGPSRGSDDSRRSHQGGGDPE